MTKDEIIETARTWSERFTRWAKTLARLIAATFPYSLIFIGILVLGIFFYWLFWQTTSPNEQKADDARVETIKADSNTGVSEAQVEKAEERVGQAEKVARNASERAQQARDKPKSNVNIDEAIRNCEEVYGKGECS